MQWTVKQGRAQDLATDVLAIPVTEGLELAPELSRAVGKKAGEQLAEAAGAAGFRGCNGTLHPVLVPGIAAGSVLLVGLGTAADFSLETLRRAAAATALKARDMGQKRLAKARSWRCRRSPCSRPVPTAPPAREAERDARGPASRCRRRVSSTSPPASR